MCATTFCNFSESRKKTLKIRLIVCQELRNNNKEFSYFKLILFVEYSAVKNYQLLGSSNTNIITDSKEASTRSSHTIDTNHCQKHKKQTCTNFVVLKLLALSSR